MRQLSVLLALLDSSDPAVEAQGWELCAALPAAQRTSVARALSARFRWGQAARSLLPDDGPRREALLDRFSIDCVAAELPLLRAAPPLHRFCAHALSEGARLSAPHRAKLARQGQEALRRASGSGPPPLVPRLVFDATVVVLSPRSRAHVARHASALICRARQEHSGDGGHVRAWQEQHFFSLLLPASLSR